MSSNNTSNTNQGQATWVPVARHSFKGNPNLLLAGNQQGDTMTKWLAGPSPYHTLAYVQTGPGTMPPAPQGHPPSNTDAVRR